MDKKIFKQIMLLVVFTVLLVAVIVNFGLIFSILGKLLHVLLPILVGMFVAFVLKRPMGFFCRLFAKRAKNKRGESVAKFFAILVSYLIFFAVIVGIFAYVIPQLVESIARFTSNLDDYAAVAIQWVERAIDYLKLNEFDLSVLQDNIQNIIQGTGDVLTYLFPQLYNFTANLIGSLFNIILGLIVSVYMLADKERVNRQIKKLMSAYLSEKINQKVLSVSRIISDTFTRFITGQALEAVILGGLCYIGLLILRIEYPLLIAILVGVTALIPVVGAFLGTIPAAFILLMINPTHAWIFVIFIIVLQQVEGNLIYPRVVGESIGLPPLWVLAAVIIGGGLGGVIGLFFAVPTASVLYQLLSKDAGRRIKVKNTPPEKTA